LPNAAQIFWAVAISSFEAVGCPLVNNSKAAYSLRTFTSNAFAFTGNACDREMNIKLQLRAVGTNPCTTSSSNFNGSATLSMTTSTDLCPLIYPSSLYSSRVSASEDEWSSTVSPNLRAAQANSAFQFRAAFIHNTPSGKAKANR